VLIYIAHTQKDLKCA